MLYKIHHMGIAVRQADEALVFYRDRLGLSVTRDARLEEQGVRGVLLDAGETEIELLQPLSTESPVGHFVARRGEGLHHLCFATDDIETELATARSKGLPVIDEQPRPGLAGMIAFLHPMATAGVLIEFAQPPASHKTATGGDAVRDGAQFDHATVATSDLAGTARIFARNFGFTASAPCTSTRTGSQSVRLPIGDSYISVATPRTANSGAAAFLSQHGDGLSLIAFSVKDLEESSQGLRRHGVEVGPTMSAARGARLAFVSPKSANGVPMQLVERAT